MRSRSITSRPLSTPPPLPIELGTNTHTDTHAHTCVSVRGEEGSFLLPITRSLSSPNSSVAMQGRLLRVRRGAIRSSTAAPACLAASTSPDLPTHHLRTSHRCFTSSLLSKIGDSVASKVSQLTDHVWLADERLVTEPRQRFERQRSLEKSLAERLATQRTIGQRLVPTHIRVDKSRQYVEFTWPEGTLEMMRHAYASASATASGSGDAAVAGDEADTSGGTATAAARPSSSPRAAPVPPCPDQPHRTRALAEYLRAFTPSTDGAMTGKDVVIYGRRGVAIDKVIPVGQYALRFVFSDGHDGGLFSYEYLYYLTGPSTKYRLMRGYVTELRRRRRPRDPPKRAPSTKYASGIQRGAAGTHSSKS